MTEQCEPWEVWNYQARLALAMQASLGRLSERVRLSEWANGAGPLKPTEIQIHMMLAELRAVRKFANDWSLALCRMREGQNGNT